MNGYCVAVGGWVRYLGLSPKNNIFSSPFLKLLELIFWNHSLINLMQLIHTIHLMYLMHYISYTNPIVTAHKTYVQYVRSYRTPKPYGASSQMPDAATCIRSKFGYQVAPLALTHCLGLPYCHYQQVLSWYLHQPESHQLSLQKVLSVSEFETLGPIDRTPGIPGSDKKYSQTPQNESPCVLIALRSES